MPFSILRIKKLKTAGAINAVGQHNARERQTLNANPAVPNRDLLTPTRPPAPSGAAVSDGVATAPDQVATGDAWDAVQARITEVGARIRSNGVLACEVFMGASPEYFRPNGGPAGTWDKQQLAAWVPAAMTWLVQEWGDKNVVRAVLHLDETTPHIQAIVVPIDPVTQRMNAVHWLGGKPKMSQMQDRYAKAMDGLGLERGVKGSLATHTRVQSWYGHLQQDVPEVPLPEVQVPGSMVWPKAREEFATQQTTRLEAMQQPAIETLETQARGRRLAVTKQREAEATNKGLVKALEAERAARAASERGLEHQIAVLRTDKEALQRRVRAYDFVSLDEAVTWFDPEELALAGVRIGKDAQGRERIFGADGKVVGRNAIDLTKAVHRCEAAGEAAAWIEVRQGRGAADRAALNRIDPAELVADVAEPRKELNDPKQGFRAKRYHYACAQVARDRPSTWEGVQGIFKRMQFDVARAWKAVGAAYTLIDSLFKIEVSGFKPPEPEAGAEPKPNPFWGWLQELERVDQARLKREELKREEEAAAIQRAHVPRGPRLRRP